MKRKMKIAEEEEDGKEGQTKIFLKKLQKKDYKKKKKIAKEEKER